MEGTEGPEHVHGDMLKGLNPREGNAYEDLLFSEKVDKIINTSSVNRYAYCYRCQDYCAIDLGDVNVTGTPCQPFSTVGFRLGVADPRILVFLMWCKLIRDHQPRIFVHENTPAFPWTLIVAILGQYYDIGWLRVSPQDVGFGHMARMRLIVYGVHKRRALVTYNIDSMWEQIKVRLVNHIMPRHALVAPLTEVYAEEVRRCNSRRIPVMAHHIGDVDYSYTFTNHEKEYLKTYISKWAALAGSTHMLMPDLCCSMNDNPERRVVWSAHSGLIPTMRTNSNMLYFPAYKRWLTWKERLTAMGFPVYEPLARISNIPVMEISQQESTMVLGNAMHLPALTCVTCGILACVRVVPL